MSTASRSTLLTDGPSLCRLLGRRTSDSVVKPEKAKLPTAVKVVDRRSTLCRLVPENAWSPIDFKLLLEEKMTEDRDGIEEKAVEEKKRGEKFKIIKV